MKILKIENNVAFFIKKDSAYENITNITKENLYYLIEQILADKITFDIEDDSAKKIRNDVERVMYSNIREELTKVCEDKEKINSNIKEFFAETYEKYKSND